MEKWEPIFWIFISGISLFAVLMLVEYLKGKMKKKPPVLR